MNSFAELLVENNAFHDMAVGHCGFEGKTFYITTDGHSDTKKLSDVSDAPQLARIKANEVIDFSFAPNMALPNMLHEVLEPEPGQLEFCMINGHIFIDATDFDIQLIE
ncbi:MAG: hypothetical protein Q4F23_03565 [Coriobacteriia bacterium]|nr:hypothetical protein [Coriobacteriia bacterium]